ncbi:hypothetical protein [Lactobacillus kalixensis]|nr:hypothetical protein [Lactobacillus kalixensis]
MKKVTKWFNYLFETDLTETQFVLISVAVVMLLAFSITALLTIPSPFGI